MDACGCTCVRVCACVLGDSPALTPASHVSRRQEDKLFAFHTPPVPGQTRNGATRLWALGDSGSTPSTLASVAAGFRVWQQQRDLTGTTHPDAMFMLGDAAYNSGSDAECVWCGW